MALWGSSAITNHDPRIAIHALAYPNYGIMPLASLSLQHLEGKANMCKLCDARLTPPHASGRRDFLKAAPALAALASAAFAIAPARAQSAQMPKGSGAPGTRYLIKGGAVLSLDSAVGELAQGDVLIEGKRIVAVGRGLDASGAAVVDAKGMIVMPGFIDTHHHQFETALRSFLADGLLFNDGQAHGAVNYFEYILGKFAPVYRPQDVHISVLFGSLSQLDAGVTAVHDISQIHHSPEHTDAVVQALADS